MHPTQYNIGGRNVSVQWPKRCDTVNPFNGLIPFEVSSVEQDYSVVYDCDLTPMEDAKTLSEFQLAENGSSCRFSVKDETLQFAMYGRLRGKMLVCMHHRFGSSEVRATACSDNAALRFSFWFAYGMLTACRRLTFVHSSVIVYDGRAVLFLGESGTGKSTHSRLWLETIKGSRLLNDDSPMLSTADGIPMVYGSPWSGKTACYIQRHFPLAAVVRLSKAPRNLIRRLTVPAALGALQPSLPPALMQHEGYADLLIDIISDTISAVPFYHLECLPDADAARVCFKAVFGH